jgi:hypothetical protein
MRKIVIILALLLAGCQTYTPQKIRYCGDFYLYTDKSNLDAEWYSSALSKQYPENTRPDGFYQEKDNSIHVMKWDFITIGHELYHGFETKGLKTDGFIHFDR